MISKWPGPRIVGPKYLIALLCLSVLIVVFAIWQIATPTSSGVKLPKYVSSPRGSE